MKILTIGDIHGRDTRKKLVEMGKRDKVIFVGDYFDSFEIDGYQQIMNFKEILQFKKDNKGKVELLIGNHDHHYLSPGENYSGKSMIYSDAIYKELLAAVKKRQLKVCHIEGNILFSHAGITKTWLTDSTSSTVININEINSKYVVADYEHFNFNKSGTDMSGDDIIQGPLWIRPNSLFIDKLDEFIQVVGHTKQHSIIYKNLVWFVDALAKNEALLLDTETKEGIVIGF